jgi:hypothetical protein
MIDMPTSKPDKKYTYADYLTWSDDERWEVIDGIPYLMAAPSCLLTRRKAGF